MDSIWVRGGSKSGKSDYLVRYYCQINQVNQSQVNQKQLKIPHQSALIFSVDAESRQNLSDRLHQSNPNSPINISFTAVTPLSFFRNEVMLFFPLLITKLNLNSQFPILLRVENEQELATNLWAEQLEGNLKMSGVSNMRLVRRILDLFLLAAYSGKKIEEISSLLKTSLEVSDQESPELTSSKSGNLWDEVGTALTQWRSFCWQKSLLTYGVITELFGQYLLPDRQYQASLKRRFKYLLMDDVDEYPAIACNLSLVMLNQGTKGLFTFNLHGSARLGLGADPEYWQQQIESISTLVALSPPEHPLAAAVPVLVDIAVNDDRLYNIPEQIDGFYSLETRSRSNLFRSVADIISEAITAAEIQPQDIAIIAPGLDNIASYALREILVKKNVPIICLNDQHPISHSAQVRSLLTLLTLVYAHLGHLISRDQVAEMLVNLAPKIDPVRAGILSDRCFVPHISEPQLLPSQTYKDWYRLGHEATESYEQIRHWLESFQRSSSPLLCLDRAIQKFLIPQQLSYERLSNLESLLETAQYYWQIGYRLGWQDRQILTGFIELIRTGTVTANPQIPSTQNSVTLATIYQYRMAHTRHRWQFWLDTGSPLWSQGGSAALFAAPIFLQDWHGEMFTPADQSAIDKQRLERLLPDLIHRAEHRVYLCYSELNTAGQEQLGTLTMLKDIANPLTL